MIKTSLTNPKDKNMVAVESHWGSPHPVTGEDYSISVNNPVSIHSTFKSMSFTVSGTTQLVLPNASGSLWLADLVITGDRVNGGSVEVRWTDDTNTAIILKPVVTDAPTALHMAFKGRVQGWKDARIDVIVTGNVSGSVLASYVKTQGGLPFEEWDSLR